MASVRAIALVLAAAACRGGAPQPTDAAQEVVHAAAEPAVPTVGERLAGVIRGTDAVERARAIKEIAGLAVKGQLGAEDGEAILRAAEVVPAPMDGGVDAQATLIDAVMIGMRVEWLPALAEIEGGLREDARERVMAGLATKDVPGGIEVIGKILAEHPDDAHAETWVALATPRKGRAAEIARWIDVRGLRRRAVRTLRRLCDARVIETSEMDEGALVRVYEEDLDDPGKAGEAVELLRVFACLPKGEIDETLKSALDGEDDETALAAAESLMAHRVKVPAGALERLAAADETRARLFDAIGERKFPAGWKTQEALARSVMVEHVGGVEEIELVEMIPVDVGGELGVLDHYVFRFREEGGSWEHGIAGPFVHADEPTTDDHGGTTKGKRVDAKAVMAEYGEPAAVVDEKPKKEKKKTR